MKPSIENPTVDKKRTEAIQLQELLYGIGQNKEVMAGLAARYDRFKSESDSVLSLSKIESFDIRNFTVEIDPDMSDGAVYLLFKGKKVGHMVIGQTFMGYTPQQQMLDLIQYLRHSNIDHDYNSTGELHEIPHKWFRDIELNLGAPGNTEAVANIRKSLGGLSFNIAELKVRPGGAPRVSSLGEGKLKIDYDLAVYYKNHLVLEIGALPLPEATAKIILRELSSPSYVAKLKAF